MTSTTGTFTAYDDVELLTRSWTIDAPRYNVLLVHGLGEHSGRWDGPAEHFIANGASVYSYDLRGHGASGGDRVDLNEFADLYRDIQAMANATVAPSGRPWVLYGHSLGGLQCAGYLIDDWAPVLRTLPCRTSLSPWSGRGRPRSRPPLRRGPSTAVRR